MNATPDELQALSAYIDNQLSSTERVALEQRLQQDTRLRAELESLQSTVALVRSLPTLKAPRNFTLDPAEFGKKPSARVISLNSRWVSRVAGLASVAALLLVVFAVMLQGAANDSLDESDKAISSKSLAENTMNEGAGGSAPMTAVAQGQAETPFPTSTLTSTPAPLPTASSAPTSAVAADSVAEPTNSETIDIQAYAPPEVEGITPMDDGLIHPPGVPVPPSSGGAVNGAETGGEVDDESLGMADVSGTGGEGGGMGGGDSSEAGMEADDGMSPPEGYTEVAPAAMPLPMLTATPATQASEAARSADLPPSAEAAEEAEAPFGDVADSAVTTFSATETDRHAIDLLTPVLEWWDAFIQFLSRVLFYGWWH